MVSVGGGIAIAIVVLLVAAVVGWVVFTQLRARRLGVSSSHPQPSTPFWNFVVELSSSIQLPPPTFSSYLPWKQSDNVYGPPRPAPGGLVGWFNDQVRKFKNRNDRTATGAYEQPSQGGTAGRRGFGPLDPDEAWDARVGNEADSYGYYEERELDGGRRMGPGAAANSSTQYSGAAAGADNSYSMNISYASDEEERGRGRQPTRAPGDGANPFDDDAEASLRGVSPRPMDGESRASVDTRRSAFREAV
jgi:hypothetical protein